MNGSPPTTATCRICGGLLRYFVRTFAWRHVTKPADDHPPIPVTH